MLAKLYHFHHQYHLEDIPFWKNLAAHYGSPILELGCGTGRVSLPLLREGFEIIGVDKDSDMIGILDQELEPGGTIKILQQDFTTLNLNNKFPLIIMPCNTYSILFPKDRQKVLDMVVQHLQPGGAFVFSMPNPVWMQELESEAEPEIEEIFVNSDSGNAVQVSSAWLRDGEVVKVLWHYDELFADGQVKRLSAETCHQLTSISQYFSEMIERSFALNLYCDFDRSPYTDDSDYLIVVAEIS